MYHPKIKQSELIEVFIVKNSNSKFHHKLCLIYLALKWEKIEQNWRTPQAHCVKHDSSNRGEEIYPIKTKQAIMYIVEAWRSVKSSTIMNYWKNIGILTLL